MLTTSQSLKEINVIHTTMTLTNKTKKNKKQEPLTRFRVVLLHAIKYSQMKHVCPLHGQIIVDVWGRAWGGGGWMTHGGDGGLLVMLIYRKWFQTAVLELNIQSTTMKTVRYVTISDHLCIHFKMLQCIVVFPLLLN